MASRKISNHISIREQQQEWVKAIIAQRGSDDPSTVLLKQALDVGLLVLLATSPPDMETGQYDGMSAEELARRLRPTMAGVLDFLMQHGHAPFQASSAPPAPPAPAAVSKPQHTPAPARSAPAEQQQGRGEEQGGADFSAFGVGALED